MAGRVTKAQGCLVKFGSNSSNSCSICIRIYSCNSDQSVLNGCLLQQPCFIERFGNHHPMETTKQKVWFRVPGVHIYIYYTLPATNIAPKNKWLEYDRFLWDTLFQQGRAVSFRECTYPFHVFLSGPFNFHY